MRRAALAALAVAACTGETAILVDVSWKPGVGDGADTLRLYVGTGPEGAVDFVVSDAGAARSLVEVTSPYRYVLRPEGALEDIGQLQLAAALTAGTDRIEPLAFAVAASPVSFADGELRLVRLELTTDRYIPAGPLGECALWESMAGAGSIGRDGDLDCDGTPDAMDCAPRDPTDTSTAMGTDGDGVDCGDCLDGDAPVDVGGWTIDPGSVFPGQNENDFRAANQIPPTVDCLHIDFDCSGSCGDDGDSSGSDVCGSVELTQDATSCAPRPSDCDESEPGQTAIDGEPERCDGRDSNCDERPQPPVPCALDLGGPVACRVGVEVCDDDAGRYAACVPEVVIDHFAFDEVCQTLRGAESCRFDDDPLACATAVNGTARRCKVAGDASNPTCARGERLVMPGARDANGCIWRVVGGAKQADWDVGFVPSGAPSTATPSADTTACGPELVVRAVNGDPVQRTVMIVGESAIGLGARAFFLTLEDDSNCDGAISCSPEL